MKGYVRQSTQEDVDFLSTNLRKEDAIEVLSSHGDIKEALQIGFDESEECWTIVVTDTEEVAGMYGIARYDDDVALPWLLTSPAIESIWLPFLRCSRKWVEEMNEVWRLRVAGSRRGERPGGVLSRR